MYVAKYDRHRVLCGTLCDTALSYKGIECNGVALAIVVDSVWMFQDPGFKSILNN